jgi:hypothetical protein
MAKFIPINYKKATEVAQQIIEKEGDIVLTKEAKLNIAKALVAIRENSNAERRAFLSELAATIGGWNASPPVHPGRLQAHPDYEDNEKLARYLYDTIAKYVQSDLNKEIASLKVKLYDLQNAPKV